MWGEVQSFRHGVCSEVERRNLDKVVDSRGVVSWRERRRDIVGGKIVAIIVL